MCGYTDATNASTLSGGIRIDSRPRRSSSLTMTNTCARGDVITVINHNPETVKAGNIVLEPFAYQVIRVVA